MDEIVFVYGLESPTELDYLFVPEQMLLFALINDITILEKDIPNPLIGALLAGEMPPDGSNRTYVIYMGSILLYNNTTSNPGKSSKKPFRLAV